MLLVSELKPPSVGSLVWAFVKGLALWQRLLIIAFLGLLAWRLYPQKPLPPVDNIPLVTVKSVTHAKVPVVVATTGSLVARHDIPIGVDGETGRVSAILAEVGDVVHKGQVLAKLDTSVISPQVANLRAALEQSRAEAALAAADFKRASAIVNTVGALSKEEVDKRQSTVRTSEARVKAAEAQLAEAEARLNRTDIKAPEDGLVLARSAEVGQAVTPGGATLFRLAENSEIEMRALIAEQDLPKIRENQTVSVFVTGVDAPYAGAVRLVGVLIDPQSRQAEVRVALPKDRNLRPGAYARAEILVGDDERPVLPQTAIMSEGDQSYVYVVDKDSKAQKLAVTLAGVHAGGVTIASGLKGDEKVVAVAGAFLHPGQLVHIQKE